MHTRIFGPGVAAALATFTPLASAQTALPHYGVGTRPEPKFYACDVPNDTPRTEPRYFSAREFEFIPEVRTELDDPTKWTGKWGADLCQTAGRFCHGNYSYIEWTESQGEWTPERPPAKIYFRFDLKSGEYKRNVPEPAKTFQCTELSPEIMAQMWADVQKNPVSLPP